MRAHDVRRLRVCTYCHDLGDVDLMVIVGFALMHGRCALAEIGPEGLLELPREERGKLTIGDIGPDLMRRVLETK